MVDFIKDNEPNQPKVENDEIEAYLKKISKRVFMSPRDIEYLKMYMKTKEFYRDTILARKHGSD